jgi:hypothetical protein
MSNKRKPEYHEKFCVTVENRSTRKKPELKEKTELTGKFTDL